MIKFFRKIRHKLIVDNKIGSYLVYAIGEILLVVIGILIALSINNWSEAKKEKRYLLNIYTQIQKDLQTDTLNARLTIEHLTEKNERLTDIIERKIPVSYYDTLNDANYKDCKKCTSDITHLIPFQNLDKGYQLLKALNTSQNFKEDSLINIITQFYSEYIPSIETSYALLTDFSIKALDDYKQFDWFVSYANFGSKTYNKEFISYIFESENHRKACAHYLIFSKFSIRILTEYRNKSVQIQQLIEKKLDK